MAPKTDRDYKTRLAAVLRRRDPEALHLFLRQSAAGYGDERQVADVESRSHAEMEELMHRMIVARPDLADLHGASRTWLAERVGSDRTSASMRAFPRAARPARPAERRGRRQRLRAPGRRP